MTVFDWPIRWLHSAKKGRDDQLVMKLPSDHRDAFRWIKREKANIRERL